MFGNLIGKLTVKPLLWAIAALLLALTVLTTLYVGRGATIDAQATALEAKDEALKLAAANLRDAADANRASADVIADLNARLKAAIGQNQAVEAANQKARAELAAAQRERQRQAAEIARLKENIYATDPNAAAWSRAAVPGRIAGQLQHRWDALRAGAADGGGGAGPAVRGPGPRAAGGLPAAAPAADRPAGFRGLSDRLPEQPADGRRP